MQLLRHPATPSNAIQKVAVAAERQDDKLRLRYDLDGAHRRLRSQAGAPVRTDELWRHTCFEAFVMGEGRNAYREFNFAPSGAWAAYDFDDRRAGMREAEAAPAVRWEDGVLQAEVVVSIAGDWRLNLTAVIEEIDGTKSYWALAHPDGPPDFHDPACFVLDLPAPR